MGSYAISLYPILKAIKGMGGIIPVNEKQTRFVEKYLAFDDLPHIPELQVWVSGNADELNQMLAGHGFQSQFPVFEDDQFGILSLLELALQWLQVGETRTIDAQNGKEYDGVYLCNPYAGTSILVAGNRQHPHETVSWQTRDNSMIVSVSIADKPLLGLMLFDYVSMICVDYSAFLSLKYSGVVFPRVSLHCIEDMKWVVDMQVGHNRVAQATQENIVKMDEYGMEVKSATEITMTAMGAPAVGREPQPYIIDRPFYLWLSRVGCKLPLLVAYVDYNSWC